MNKIKTLTAEQFNAKYPVGTKIKYYPIFSDRTRFKTGKTTSEAWDNYGTVLVLTDIMGGGLLIRNIEVQE